MRALALRRWPELLTGLATLAFGLCVFGFGLVFRPLHNDEGVTLRVASHDSLSQVLDLAVNYRHGPPLHYALVHASLLWRQDLLGLRLPSAALGVACVLLAYGFGRELLGRPGAALVAVTVASSPVVVHLSQFARGYTAMLAAGFLSLWLLLLLTRTRRARWIAPYGASAVLLAAAHPFGLLALLSELVLLVVLGMGPQLRSRQWRALLLPGLAVVSAAAALIALRQVYAPLQSKYGAGEGSAVVDPLGGRFWKALWQAWSGSSREWWWLVLAAVALAGLIVLWRRDRRAGLVCTVWLGVPLVLLSVLSASSSDFAPERHLSFLLPAYAVCLAGAVLELSRRAGPWAAAGAMVVLLAPGVVAIAGDVGNFSSDLRDAGVRLAASMRPGDVLLTTGGRSEPGVDSRLYGSHAVLDAPDGTPLGRWAEVDAAAGCALADKLRVRPTPDAAWLLVRPPDPDRAVQALAGRGASPAVALGEFVLARLPVPDHSVAGALEAGAQAYRALAREAGPAADFARLARQYRLAATYEASGLCDGG